MKATTIIVALVIIGLLFELGVVPLEASASATLGGQILNSILPPQLGGSESGWGTFVLLTAGVLSFGVVLLGQKLPYASFLLMFMGLMTAPIGILTSSTVAMPNTIKVLFGITWLGMFISAAVAMFRNDA